MPSLKINAHRRSPTALGPESRVLVYPASPGFEAFAATLADLATAETVSRRRAGFSFYSDFIGATNAGLTADVSEGTVAAGTATTSRPGVIAASTGVDEAGRAGYGSFASALLFGGGDWSFEGEFQLGAVSDGTDTYTARLGFVDSVAGAPVDGAWFQHDGTGANWLCKTSSNSTVTSTGSGVAAGTGWVRFKVAVTGTTSVAFSIDGSVVATHITNLPSVAGRESGFGLSIIKSAGTTSRAIRCDWLQVDFVATSLIRA